MTDGQIVKRNESAIAPWASRNEIREIAQRVQLMAPGGKKLNENEALALAQGAVSHGLDPFNGEIWYIPGSGLMAGVKGLRKAARTQVHSYWTEFDRIDDPDERKVLQIPDGALAFKCKLYDSTTIGAYSDGWKRLSASGVPAEVIPNVIGKRPYTEGVGYLKNGEKTKMDPAQAAMKRSEADALKRRFDLPFAVAVTPEEGAIDVEWSEVSDTDDDDDLSARANSGKETLFGKAEPKRPSPAETVRNKLKTFVLRHDNGGHKANAEQRGLAMGMLNECFSGEELPDEKRHSVLQYLFKKNSGTDLEDAHILALLDWQEPYRPDEGAPYTVSSNVCHEAHAIVEARMHEQGQTGMFDEGSAGMVEPPAEESKTNRPLATDKLKAMLARKAGEWVDGNELPLEFVTDLSDGLVTVLTDDETVKRLATILVDEPDLSGAPDAKLYALHSWLKPTKDADGVVSVDKWAKIEALAAVNVDALKEADDETHNG